MSDLAKQVAGGISLGALVGSKGPKFSGLDVKRVYFGCVVLETIGAGLKLNNF